MRIALVSPFFHPHAGGVESHVRELARAFARQGHEVTVLTARYRRELPVEESWEGYRIVRHPCRAVLFNTPIDPGVGPALERLPVDIAHLHYPPPVTPFFAVRAARRRRLPVCLTYHCDLYLPGGSGRLLTGLYERVLLPGVLDRSTRLVVHTRSYALTSAGLRGRAVTVIPSVVDLDRFRPGLEAGEVRRALDLEGKRVLAFTGRLVPHKGLDVVLRALAELPRDVELLAIGSGPRLDELRHAAIALGVGGRTHFLPSVSNAELPRYLAAADLFVFPSQNRLEGFGLAVAEAMAAGLPVVTADMPGVREVIEPGREGLLAQPLLADDLAKQIRTLLEDEPLRRRMGEAARRRAEQRYGADAVTAQLLAVYAEAIGPR